MRKAIAHFARSSSLKIQKGAKEIYDHLKRISTRFNIHFDNIVLLRKKLEEAMTVVDSFGKDARSINRSLEAIKNQDDDINLLRVINNPPRGIGATTSCRLSIGTTVACGSSVR